MNKPQFATLDWLRLSFRSMDGWWEAALLFLCVVLIIADRFRRIDALGREIERQEQTSSK